MLYKTTLIIFVLTSVICSAQFDFTRNGDVGINLLGHRATLDVAEAVKGDLTQGSLGLGVETPYGPKANTRLGGSSARDRLLGGLLFDVQAADDLGVNTKLGGGIIDGTPDLKCSILLKILKTKDKM